MNLIVNDHFERLLPYKTTQQTSHEDDEEEDADEDDDQNILRWQKNNCTPLSEREINALRVTRRRRSKKNNKKSIKKQNAPVQMRLIYYLV